MGMLDNYLSDLRKYIGKKENVLEIQQLPVVDWPSGGDRNLVMSRDAGVELGNPRQESLSSILWVEDKKLVKDGVITLIGEDLPQSAGNSLPFGKVVIAGVSGFNEENSYDRYKEMELLRYELDLYGYMMRAVSQYQREWSRVSKKALQDGFSFRVLGSALMNKFREKSYVDAVEVVFVTSGKDDVKELRTVVEGAAKVISALNKMVAEMSFECGECEYNDVCSEVSELRRIRDSLQGKRAANSEK